VPDYARPQTLNEALKLVADGDWCVLAGGTDLYPGAGIELARPVLDLSAVAGLAGLHADDGVRIGSATSWTTIAEAELPPAFAALQQAARQVGGRQVQNAGTIGGNLCNASPAADGVPPLLALDAEVELTSSAGTRTLPLAQFLLGPRRTALAEGELLTAIRVPDRATQGRSAFLKLGARSHLVISIAMVAARLVVRSGQVTEAAVAVGACSAVACRLPAVEAALMGASVAELESRVRASDVAAALSPIDDVRATSGYRHAAATTLVSRALALAAA
jgi:CO/xanthine dehydrogenase FAD-binding subunit